MANNKTGYNRREILGKEAKYYRTNYLSMTYREMADMHGRSMEVVYLFLKRCGLSKPRNLRVRAINRPQA